MLIVAPDRISVFDVVLDDLVPDKGRALTALSTFWFEETAGLAPNHLISSDPTDFPETAGSDVAGGRCSCGRRNPSGSSASGAGICSARRGPSTGTGARSTAGRCRPACGRPSVFPSPSSRPRPRPSPARRAAATDVAAAELVGSELLERIRDITLRVYGFGRAGRVAGLILADTKLEFGTIGGELLVIDEMLTPDSSRYWPADEYRSASRRRASTSSTCGDHYLATDWDHTPPAPPCRATSSAGHDPATSRRTSC